MPTFTKSPQEAVKLYEKQSNTLKQKLVHTLNKFKKVAQDEAQAAQVAIEAATSVKVKAESRVQEVDKLLAENS